MPPLAIDEAWSKIPPATLRQYGYAGAFLYLSHDVSKAASPADVEALHTEGRGIGFVFEDNAGRWRGGRSQGLADGTFANAAADALGHPRNLPLYCAVDQELATDADFATALAYVQGFDAAGPRHGRGYGEWDLIEKLYAAGLGEGWQACAWSGSKVSSHAAVYQRVKSTTDMAGSFDEDVLLDPTGAGLWYPSAPIAAPSVALEEDEMDVVRDSGNKRCYLRTAAGQLFYIATATDLDAEQKKHGPLTDFSPAYLSQFPGYRK